MLSKIPSLGKYQAQRMTHLTRDIAVGRHKADWVVLLDGDEFLVIPQGSSLIPDSADGTYPLSIHWRSYVPDEKDDLSELNPAIRIKHRRVADPWEFSKVIVPGPLAAIPSMRIAQGNHSISVDNEYCKPRPCGGAYLAHIPLRNLGQYATKVAITSLQYRCMAKRDSCWAFHYQEPFELLKKDMYAFNGSIGRVALRYSLPPDAPLELAVISDPIPYSGDPLRHTPKLDSAAAAWQAVLLYAEDIAHQHAVLAANLSDEEHREVEHQAMAVADLYDQLEKQRRQIENLLAGKHLNWDSVEKSWTWRIGRLFVGPLSWIHRLIFHRRPVVK